MLASTTVGRHRFGQLLFLATLALIAAAAFGTTSASAAAPVCTDANYTVEAGVPLEVPINGPCTDGDGDILQGQVVSFPSNGSLTPGPNGGGIYTSNPSFSGTDSFTYRASDGTSTSNTATATIEVTPGSGGGNQPPQCFAQFLTEYNGQGVSVSPGCFDFDSALQDSGITVVDPFQNGELSGPLSFSAAVTYTSDPGFTGTDTMTFTVSDGIEESALSTITIDVQPFPEGNLPPTCPESHAFVPEGGQQWLIANCVDPDGDPITYNLAPPNVQRGQLISFTSNSVLYKPSPTTVAGMTDVLGYSARDQFHNPINFAVTITITEAGETEFETAPEATETEPFAASVGVPAGSTDPVYLDTRAVTETAPTGYFFLGTEFDITAPMATDPADPLRFVFKLDASEIADLNVPVDEIEVFRNGVLIEDCDDPGAGVAEPWPCIDDREIQTDGDLWITALTMQASIYNFGAVDGPPDNDGDGVPDETDNCAEVANADQTDRDADGVGAACDSKEVPVSKVDCKKNGWRNFNGVFTFRNQGDCVSYVATGSGNGPAG